MEQKQAGLFGQFGGQYVPEVLLPVLDELAAADEEVVDTLNGADTDYLFELRQATQVLSVPNKSEHFVNITLRFNLVTFNNN